MIPCDTVSLSWGLERLKDLSKRFRKYLGAPEPSQPGHVEGVEEEDLI